MIDTILDCPNCGAKNRVKASYSSTKIPVCSKCRSQLVGFSQNTTNDNFAIKACPNCGAKNRIKDFYSSTKIPVCAKCRTPFYKNSKVTQKENFVRRLFRIEFVKFIVTIGLLFAISLIVAALINENSRYGSYEEVAMGLPFFLSSIILVVFFFRNTLNVKKIWRIFILLIAIAGVVSSSLFSYQQYERAERYQAKLEESRRLEAEKKRKEAERRRERERIEAEKKKELRITISKLKNKIYLSNQGLDYNTGSWKEDDTVYYSHEGNYTYRNVIKGDTHYEVYGVQIKGRIANKMKYRTVKVKVEINARGEIGKNCALLGCVKWGGKRIDDSFTINVPPGGKNFSKYYDLVTKAWSVGIGITGGESHGTYLESKPEIKVTIIG